MNEINYKWKMEGLARGVDPSIALQELNRIQDLYGSVTPEIVVNESKNPISSFPFGVIQFINFSFTAPTFSTALWIAVPTFNATMPFRSM